MQVLPGSCEQKLSEKAAPVSKILWMTDWPELSNCGHTKCCLCDQPAAVLESLWFLGNITRDLRFPEVGRLSYWWENLKTDSEGSSRTISLEFERQQWKARQKNIPAVIRRGGGWRRVLSVPLELESKKASTVSMQGSKELPQAWGFRKR